MTAKRRQHNRITYQMESWVIRCRDLIRSPAKVLHEVGVRSGMTVLDFGCGPGGFSLAAAQLVGPEGRVYAVDRQPSTLDTVRRRAAARRIENIWPIPGEHIHQIPPESIDFVLLYDVIHIDPEPVSTLAIIAAIHRVLKSGGMLSVSDHHLNETAIQSIVTGDGFFRFVQQTNERFQFEKIETNGVVK